jgi:hypothetical protein
MDADRDGGENEMWKVSPQIHAEKITKDTKGCRSITFHRSLFPIRVNLRLSAVRFSSYLRVLAALADVAKGSDGAKSALREIFLSPISRLLSQ